MIDKERWKRIIDFNQQERDNANRKLVDMRQKLNGAFADPEAYAKIATNNDQGIPGLNLAVRKHCDAKDEFNKVFIDRAKKYSECKDDIKKKSATLKDEFQKAANIAKKHGLRCNLENG